MYEVLVVIGMGDFEVFLSFFPPFIDEGNYDVGCHMSIYDICSSWLMFHFFFMT